MMMRIIIRSEKSIELTVESSNLIRDIKQRLVEMEGIPIDEQTFSFSGRSLKNEVSLADCRVQDGSTIQLVLPIADKINTLVKSETGETIEIAVHPKFFTHSIKVLYKEKTGFPIEQQCLIFNGKVLDGFATVHAMKIKTGSVIQIVNMMTAFGCPHCSREYDAERIPHLLHCGHSYCADCIKKLFGNSDRLECPTCHCNVSKDECDAGFPAVHDALVKAIPKAVRLTGGDSIFCGHEIVCKNCSGQQNPAEATRHCNDCRVDFCDTCDEQIHAKIHAFEFMRAQAPHERIPLENKPIVDSICETHRQPTLRICTDCRKLVCGDCVLSDGPHQGHKHRLASKLIDEWKGQIAAQGKQCFQDVISLRALSTNLGETEARIRRNENDFLDAFHEDAEFLKAAFQNRLDSMEAELRTKVQARVDECRGKRQETLACLAPTDAAGQEADVAVRRARGG